MTFLPIVERELRVASRRRMTYWGRTLLTFLAIAIGVCTYCLTLGEDRSWAGPMIFRWLAGVLLLYALFYGARSTADSLSSEKRDGTLGLLFLTDLNGYDVVLGKMAATSLNGFYGLLGVFPVLAVPLLMGGTSQGEFWRMVLVLMDTFLFSLAVGIFASAICREARSAMSANFLMVIFPTIMLPGVAGVIVSSYSPSYFIRELLLASPGYPFVMSFDLFYAKESQYFWLSLATIHALTWICVILASSILPRIWQDRPIIRPVRPGLGDLWRRGRYGGPTQRAALRAKLLARNAFLWLACRDRRKRRRVWMFLAFMLGWWLWGRIQFGNLWYIAPISMVGAFLTNSAIKMWIAFETSERLAEDRGSGALELLLSTRLTVSDILKGQWLALLRIFFWPLVAVFAAEFYLMWISLGDLHSPNFTEPFLTWLAMFIMVPADAIALFWVGLYAAMTSRKPSQAATVSVLRVLALPWVFLGMARTFMTLGAFLEWFPDPGYLFFLGHWFFCGLLVDVFFGLRARRQLLTRFRQLPNRAIIRRKPRVQ